MEELSNTSIDTSMEEEEEEEDAGGCWYHEYFVMTLQAEQVFPTEPVDPTHRVPVTLMFIA